MTLRALSPAEHSKEVCWEPGWAWCTPEVPGKRVHQLRIDVIKQTLRKGRRGAISWVRVNNRVRVQYPQLLKHLLCDLDGPAGSIVPKEGSRSPTEQTRSDKAPDPLSLLHRHL
jgi:hypothetical protein